MRSILVAIFAAILLAVGVAALPAVVQTELPEVRLSNGAKLTTSGLSGGAYLAQQFGVAFSGNVSGVGVFAGGPYYCAQNTETLALTTCMVAPVGISVSDLVKKAKQFADEGKIDDLSNLKRQKVFLYSGVYDAVVYTGVVKKIEDFYAAVDAKVTATEYSILAAHGMPTLTYGNPCVVLGAPFVLKCDYDGAGNALRTMYGLGNLKPATDFSPSQLVTLKQHDFLPKGKSSVGFGESAYAYIPRGCQDSSAVCDIHVVWHGCNQNEATVNGAMNVHGGYDGYAESNNIIMLYPQAARAILKNPQGCFDWWGYADDEYAFKSGAQMAAVMNMVNYLASGGR